MSRGSHRDDGYCWTTWISWCTFFIQSCASSTSSSACGATHPCSPRAPPRVGRKDDVHATHRWGCGGARAVRRGAARGAVLDRKSTRLNSSHQIISYAVFCLKKKKLIRY